MIEREPLKKDKGREDVGHENQGKGAEHAVKKGKGENPLKPAGDTTTVPAQTKVTHDPVQDVGGSKEKDIGGPKGKNTRGPKEKPEVRCDPPHFQHRRRADSIGGGKGEKGCWT